MHRYFLFTFLVININKCNERKLPSVNDKRFPFSHLPGTHRALVVAGTSPLCPLPAGLLYVGFTACMFGLYSFMPVVIKKTSATAVNLSLLTADLYSLFCGLFLFHYKVS